MAAHLVDLNAFLAGLFRDKFVTDHLLSKLLRFLRGEHRLDATLRTLTKNTYNFSLTWTKPFFFKEINLPTYENNDYNLKKHGEFLHKNIFFYLESGIEDTLATAARKHKGFHYKVLRPKWCGDLTGFRSVCRDTESTMQSNKKKY